MKTTPTHLARLCCRALSSLKPTVSLFAFALSFTALHAQLPSPWLTQDVGTTGATGSATYNSGTFTVLGAGAEVYGTVDAFRYVYQAMSGDFTIVARVATEQNTSQWAKVGVMVRESLANNAAYSFVFITPDQTGTDNGILFESRASTGASATQTTAIAGLIAPYWLRLARVGNTFTAARSTDGTNWTTVGSQTITMATGVQVGLVVCSHVNGTLNTSTFTNVSVTNNLPAGWFTQDVGAVGAAGSASESGGTFTVIGAGAEIYNTADAFRYAYQTLTGDSTITVRLATEQNTNQWAKVGVMFREDLTAGSKYAFFALTPDQPTGTDRGFLFEYRTTTGGSAAQNINATGFIAPYWLRLARSGNTFTASRSTDNITWTVVGTAQSVPMNATLNVGLVVCSHADPTLNTSTFTNVTAVQGDTTPPTVSVTAPASGALLRGNSVTVSATASDNVGVVGVQFKLDGVNLGTEDTTSPYSITWDTTTATNGTHTLTAVARDAATNSTTSTGVSVTVDNAAPTISITAPTGGATVSGNAVAVSATASDNIGVVGVQFTLDGGNLQAEDTTSPYGITWDTTLVTNGSHSIAAVARDAAGNSTTSTAVNVTVSNSLPPGWSSGDIGAVGAAGTTNYSAGTYIIDGSGVNIWNTSDEFQFARQSISGDYTIVAHVTGVENTNQWAKGGVMIRESLAPDSKYVFVLMTPNNGLLFEQRATTGGSSTQSGTVSTIDPPQWVRLSRTGNSFAASYSSDNINWIAVPGSPVTVSMTASAYAGLAVSSLVDGTLCTATFDNVSITAGGGGGGTFNPTYPRLGIYAIGGDQSYPSTVWPMLAKFHVVFMAGNWESWANGRSYTRQDVVNGIKAASTVGTKVFQYVIFESVWDDAHQANAWNPTWKAIANTNNWWVYVNGTSGTKVVSDFNTGQWVINHTQYSPVDPGTGLRPYQSAAKFSYDMFIAGAYTPGNAAPALDGFFLDNTFCRPRKNGDWNRDGTTDTYTDPAVGGWYRNGQKYWYDKIVTLMPGKLQVGNNADFPIISTTDQNAIAPLSGVLNGGVNEGILGASYSPENQSGGTALVMAYYKYCMDATAAPKLQLFEHSKLTTTGSDPIDATPYRAMRHGFAACLMNDGYYNGENTHSSTLSEILWFDEYTAGALGTGYLGMPSAGSLGAVQTAPRWAHGTKGVWAREFTGGIAIMNPKGNGTQVITVGASGTDLLNTAWKRFSGTQAPTINDGTNVTANITLADRDGIILLRR